MNYLFCKFYTFIIWLKLLHLEDYLCYFLASDTYSNLELSKDVLQFVLIMWPTSKSISKAHFDWILSFHTLSFITERNQYVYICSHMTVSVECRVISAICNAWVNNWLFWFIYLRIYNVSMLYFFNIITINIVYQHEIVWFIACHYEKYMK